MLKKRMVQVLSAVMAICFMLPLTVSAAPVWAAQHQDKQTNGTGNKFGTAAQYMTEQAIMKGDGKGNYNLSGYINRGDLMVMLVRAFNLRSNAGGNHFGDVNAQDYYYGAVSTTHNLGIALGNGKNFMPRSYVTLEQAILFIQRTMKHKGIALDVDLESLFDEDELSAYATREDICELLYYVKTGNTDGFDGDSWWNHNSTGSMKLTYETDQNEAVALDASDFTDALADVAEDETLSYVKFTLLPSSASGVLYEAYDADSDSNTKVTVNTSYDADALDEVAFVPGSDVQNTVTIFFTAYTEENNLYRGKIVITVGDAGTAADAVADAVSYTTGRNEAVAFVGDDFAAACSNATGETFSTLKFTALPSSSLKGTLYSDYDAGDSTHTQVTTTASYDEDALSDLTFVPKSGYSGTVNISYTGETEDGTEYTGTVKITVKNAPTIAYAADENEAVTLDGADFADACGDVTGKTFSYVKFTSLPNSSDGVLYYDYDKDDDTHITVTTSQSYSESALSSITFVPASDTTGTVTVPYVGYTTGGASYTGMLQITVG